MTEKLIDELQNEILNQVVQFDKKLFDRKWEIDDRMRKLASDIVKMVDVYNKEKLDDFDLWVFLTYRQGKMRSKNTCIKKLEPKSLVNVLAEGIEIPDDATMVEIEIKPVIRRNYDRTVSTENIYSVKFGLTKGEELLSEDQLKRRYKLTPKENLYSVRDMSENSKILKFYNRKKRAKERYFAKENTLSL